MFRIFLTLVIGLVLLLVTPVAVAGQSQATEPARTILVSGTGQASAEPDEAVIRVGVDVRGADARSAMDRAARRMDAVIAALQEAGVDAADITTVRLDLDRYRTRNADREVVDRGWRVSNRVRATVRDIDDTSAAIDAAVAAGATAIDSIRFGVSDPADAIAEARVAAIDSAATAAATLAAASGLEVLEVVRIVEGSAGDRVAARPYLDSAMSSAEQAVYSTPVEPGLVEVSTTVTVEYTIG